tara:strand:+ start:399 stop:821 length:423 start_codon:yes stop_codon:yes gene_type:complete
MKNDEAILESLRKGKAPCTDTLGAKILKFSSSPPEIEMQFEAIYEFTHSDGQVVQGGFVTGMLDAPMAHLLMGLFNFKIIPMTLDINVSFLAPSRQGILISRAKCLKMGKSTAFMTSELFQQNILVASATSTVKLVPNKT